MMMFFPVNNISLVTWSCGICCETNSNRVLPMISSLLQPVIRSKESEIKVKRSWSSISQHQSEALSVKSRKRCSFNSNACWALCFSVISLTASKTAWVPRYRPVNGLFSRSFDRFYELLRFHKRLSHWQTCATGGWQRNLLSVVLP